MLFITKLISSPVFFFLTVLAVFPSICLHEYMHARVAVWCGDHTPEQTGYLTLNPLKLMGWMSIVMFCLLGFAWGSVPVNPYNLTKKGRILTAFAGPAVNFVLFVLAWIILFLLTLTNTLLTLPGTGVNFLMILGLYNAVLFFFNLLPVPGLDGWHILIEFAKVPALRSEVTKGALLLLILLIFVSIDYLFRAGFFLMEQSFALAAFLRSF